MQKTDKILEGFESKPFSMAAFIRDHKVGILGTIAFHLIILIILLLVKIQSLKEINDLDIVLEYMEMPEPVSPQEEESREELLSRLLEQQLRQSNQAVNISQLEEEISTENYVDEVMKDLEEQRSEEWLKQQEELTKILDSEDLVPVEPEPENEEEKEFTGPTNINYEFLETPFDRKSRRLPVPVYKCQGFGVVEVNITVNNAGKVTSAKANVLEATQDPQCLAEVAERFALMSSFRGDLSAPQNHSAKIIYSFVAQ
jgi:CRISPR/Cas system-associated protein Cas5 (RAMP superfamily)